MLYILFTPNLTSVLGIIFNIILGILFSLGYGGFITNSKIAHNKKGHEVAVTVCEQNLQSFKESNEREYKRSEDAIKKKKYLLLQVDELNKTLEDTKETLREFYGNSNLVFPKYLNLMPITQILEYFQAGRCDTLTGPHGAYNLYEAELRMNRIITNLDQVIYNLEEIRENQYLIYSELCRGNELAEKILDDVSASNAYLRGIEVNSAVSSYNSQVVAHNSSICAFNTSFS